MGHRRIVIESVKGIFTWRLDDVFTNHRLEIKIKKNLANARRARVTQLRTKYVDDITL